MKRCSRCGQEKPVTDFYRDRSKKDKLQSYCKACVKAYQQSPIGKASLKRSRTKSYGTIWGYLGFIYIGMIRKCNNPDCKDYKYYGARGIKVCFKSLDDFRDYVMNVLQVDPRGLTIDRINNDGSYEKGNIRFVSQAENNRNKRKHYCYV